MRTNYTKEIVGFGIIWTTIWSIINFSGWINTVGVFNTSEGSLLVPSIWGAVINLIVFVGNSHILIPRLLKRQNITTYFAALLFSFVLLVSVDSFLDARYYIYFYKNAADFKEIWIGNAVIDFFFILIPSFLYRFGRDWFYISETSSSPDKNYDRTISVKSGNSLYQVAIDDIRFLESDGNYVRMHTTKKSILIRDSISNQLSRLPEEKFIRCHKSFVVAVRHVSRIDTDSIWIDDKEIPIGRVFKPNVRAAFN